MKPVLSACTGDRCISSKACEQSGPLLGSKKLHAAQHLTELSPAGITGPFFRRERKMAFSFTYTSVFCFPLLVYFPVSYKSFHNYQK